MYYDNELELLCDTFRKSRIRPLVLTPDDIKSEENRQSDALDFRSEIPIFRLMEKAEPKTMYKYADAFGLCYVYLLLSGGESQRLLFVGPYLAEPMSSSKMLEIGEKNGISPKRQRHLEEYYSGLTVLPADSHLFLMLDTFCERMWKSPSFAIVDVGDSFSQPPSPINASLVGDSFDDLLVSMKAMEKRYSFENEMIRAVSLGQLHEEGRLLSALSEKVFEMRTQDPLRNVKNYGIIMNTLLRKAAEQGGVHPMYLDKVSSLFAVKIEQTSSVAGSSTLMREMFRSYCKLVRKHAMKHFSEVVRRAILLIDADLSSDISLSTLAENQGISAGYLSTVFKKETGKTVSEYVRDKRMRYAAHLLGTTSLQVQTVALHCGILDVQYFSKLFKRQTGMTPREYRESAMLKKKHP